MGKYALIKLRVDQPHQMDLFPNDYRISKDAVDFGNTPETDFFVIRIKDKYAAPALAAYALAAEMDGQHEYAREIDDLAAKADRYPNPRKPD